MSERVYLREWRLAKGLTQPDLAKRVGTVKSEVSRLEKGSRRMTLDWMKKFAKALGISIDDLMSVPPIGFGAVAPAPDPEENGQTFSIAKIGDVVVGVKRNILSFAPVTGDDWTGMFSPGDVLIYDLSRKNLDAPGIFVLDVGGETIARRVTPADGGYSLTCANPSYPASRLEPRHTVLGRVVARVHRL